MEEATATKEAHALCHDLGTFEGFNFRNQSAICPNHTANEVVNWDHDKEGEAEFWPSGDNEGVQLVFKGQSSVTYSELLALDKLLDELGGDNDENFLKVYYAVHILNYDLGSLNNRTVDDEAPLIFCGSCFTDVRKEAAYELFELYHPEEYRIWEKSLCDGLIFDTDHFLDSPVFSVDEIQLREKVALLVKPQ